MRSTKTEISAENGTIVIIVITIKRWNLGAEHGHNEIYVIIDVTPLFPVRVPDDRTL